MAWKKVHIGRRVVMGAALPALVVVVGISVVMLRTAADPVLRTISAGLWESPCVVDESSGHAFVGITDPGGHIRIAMLDAATGAVVRIIPMPGWARLLAVDEQTARIVAASPDGVRVLDARSGALVRVVHLSPTPNAAMVDERAGRIYVAGFGGTTCTNQTCTTSDGVLAVLDARSGRLLHTTTLHHQGWTALALDGHAHHLTGTSTVGVISTQGAVSIFDRASATVSARLLYRSPLAPVVRPSPVVDEVTGRAFLLTASYGGRRYAGSLEVLDTHSGRLLRAIPFGTGLADVALDERIGRVFATAFGSVRMVTIPESGGGSVTFPAPAGAGSVWVIDARSGVVLRTIPIGPATTAVAVDGRRGRLYVTNWGAVDPAGNFV